MKIAIIGEFNAQFRPHVATNEALEHVRLQTKVDFVVDWVSTETVASKMEEVLAIYAGFWIAPGSPYKNMMGAINLIQQTRERGIPTLGTCGGFQHIAIEFARNVLQIEDAEHAEYNPYASKLVVNPLSCDLKGEPMSIEITRSDSKTAAIYPTSNFTEKYYCNFGLNPDYQQQFDDAGLRIVASDIHREARILELIEHPFFIATLFVPQDNSSLKDPHPLVASFIKAVANIEN